MRHPGRLPAPLEAPSAGGSTVVGHAPAGVSFLTWRAPESKHVMSTRRLLLPGYARALHALAADTACVGAVGQGSGWRSMVSPDGGAGLIRCRTSWVRVVTGGAHRHHSPGWFQCIDRGHEYCGLRSLAAMTKVEAILRGGPVPSRSPRKRRLAVNIGTEMTQSRSGDAGMAIARSWGRNLP